ncbi:DMSO reductase anchor subunit [Burkholderiales bacterium JOSHI_001]|nr:DMSO reductase anchor subunit [Burkholderiales bacterium JOSHI_001]
MNPALSVVFLTTLIGAGQGLYLALFAAELAGFGTGPREADFLVTSAVLAVVLTGLGLLSSFFHLGRPERAWRAAAMWRTSWLSREVIALPAFMGLVALWGLLHFLGAAPTRAVGAVAALAAVALFVCTAMIYASIRFIQEWASVFTLANYTLLGCASGALLAAALAAQAAPALRAPFTQAALLLTLLGAASRGASLLRNARLKPRSTVQSAIGIKHPQVAQRAQGFMGGSFNTREFFHGRAAPFLRNMKWGFILLAFVLPALMLGAALGGATPAWLGAAFVLQYAGLLAERWFFFAQANHPQNLYYQVVS